MMLHPLVVLEGLSGVGKTTVAHAVAAEIGGVVCTTPGAPWRDIRDAVDREVDAQSRYLFYLAAVTHASRDIARLLETSPVVCDRFIASTHCWHEVIGADVYASYASLRLLEPDISVLVTCDEAERLDRLTRRGRSYNDEAEEELGLDRLLLAAYRAFLGDDRLEVVNSGAPRATALRIVKAL